MKLLIIYVTFATFALLGTVQTNQDKNWDLIFMLKEERGVALTSQFSILLEPTTDYSKMFLPAKTLFPENILPPVFIIVIRLKYGRGMPSTGTILSISDPDQQRRLSMTIYVNPGDTDKVMMTFLFHPVEGKLINHDVVLPLTNQTHWTFGISIRDDAINFFVNCWDIKREYAYQSLPLLSDPNRILFKDGAVLNLFHEVDGSNKLRGEVVDFTITNNPQKLSILCQRELDGSGEARTREPNEPRGNVLLPLPKNNKQESAVTDEGDSEEDGSSKGEDDGDQFSTTDHSSKNSEAPAYREMKDSIIRSASESTERPKKRHFTKRIPSRTTVLGKELEKIEKLDQIQKTTLVKDDATAKRNAGRRLETTSIRWRPQLTTKYRGTTSFKLSNQAIEDFNPDLFTGTPQTFRTKSRKERYQSFFSSIAMKRSWKSTGSHTMEVSGGTTVMSTETVTTIGRQKEITVTNKEMNAADLKNSPRSQTEISNTNAWSTTVPTPKGQQLRSSGRPSQLLPLKRNVTENKSNLKEEEVDIERCKTILTKNECKEMDRLRLSIPKPGERGPKGEKGNRGDKGAIGPLGVPGTCDASLCRSIVTKGDKGDAGGCDAKQCTSVKGDKGEMGSKGNAGLKGEIGESNVVNLDLIKNLVTSMIPLEMDKMEKNIKGNKGEPGECDYTKVNNQMKPNLQENLNIGYGSLVFEDRESLEKVSFHLPVGSMVFLSKLDIFLIKIDPLNNIWKSIALESKSKDWILPGPPSTTSIEPLTQVYSNGLSKRLYLVALTTPTLGDLKLSAYQPGGYTGAAFQCQHIGAIKGYGRLMHPLINTDMFNIRYVIHDMYKNVPIYNSRGEILANDIQSLLAVKEDLQNEILDFERHSIINNTMSPCVWIGKDPIPEYLDYQTNSELKCNNWMTRHPLSKALASSPVPLQPMLSDANLKPRACSLQCHILCIQTEPSV